MKVPKKAIIDILMILPCVVPPGIYQIPMFSIFARLKYLSFVLVILFYYKDFKHKKNDGLLNSIIVFCLLIFLLTLSRSGDIMLCISTIVDIINPTVWVYYIFKHKTNYSIKGLQGFLFGIIVFNFILTISLPMGIYQPSDLNNGVYLLGDKNKVIEYLLPALAIIQYNNAKIKEEALYKWMIYAMCAISIWCIDSVTSLMVLLFYILLVEISENYKVIKQLISFRILFLFLIVMTIMILSGWLMEVWIVREISSATGRSINFSGRTTLWAQAIELIEESPLVGYGITDSVYRKFVFQTDSGILEGFSTHDGYLRLLLEGGMLELVSYIYIFLVLKKNIMKIWKESDNVNKFSYCIICILLVFIMEAEYYSSLFIMVIVFAWKESQLILSKKTRQVYKKGDLINETTRRRN